VGRSGSTPFGCLHTVTQPRQEEVGDGETEAKGDREGETGTRGRQGNARTAGRDLGPHGVNLAEFVRRYNDASRDQEGRIAETKMPDLNAGTTEAAMKVVQGTARSMGIGVSD
jgi:hypothetical protein